MARWWKEGFCKKELHELTPENTYITTRKDGTQERACIRCKRDYYNRNRDKIIANVAAWQKKNREHVSSSIRVRYAADEEKRLRLRQYKRQWAKTHKDSDLLSKAKYRMKNRDKLIVKNAEQQQQRYVRLRREIVALYGGKCVRCDFDDERALQLDHVNGLASRYRLDIVPKGARGVRLYPKILNGKLPKEDFQLLCANCNWIKRHENGEYKRRTVFARTEVEPSPELCLA